MSLLCMPWIVVNLGGEMLYVLEQRLAAQGVAPDKAGRVLADVARALFDPAFLEARLFVPQDTWSLGGTKKIFERVAHSSIMRLSDARRAGRARPRAAPAAATVAAHTATRSTPLSVHALTPLYISPLPHLPPSMDKLFEPHGHGGLLSAPTPPLTPTNTHNTPPAWTSCSTSWPWQPSTSSCAPPATRSCCRRVHVLCVCWGEGCT